MKMNMTDMATNPKGPQVSTKIVDTTETREATLDMTIGGIMTMIYLVDMKEKIYLDLIFSRKSFNWRKTFLLKNS